MNLLNNAALLIGVPLLFAFAIPLFGFVSKELTKWVTLFVIGFEAIYALYILLGHKFPAVVVLGNWVPPFGENLYVGPVSAFLVAAIALVGLMIAVYNLWSVKRGDVVHFSILFLLFVTGAMGMVLTGDIFNLFIFMEITGISSYALVAYGPERRALGGAFKYLVVSSIGSTLYLLGVILIYTQLGTLNIAEIAARISQVSPNLLTFAGILIVAGLAVEAELFPFNGWVPDAYTGAVNGVSATLSGIGSVAGVYALFRILMTVFGKDGTYVTTYGKLDLMAVVAVFATATVIIGELSAMNQKNVKKMLAYSSMAQMGLVAIGFAIGSQLGVYGGIFQLINHSIAKALLFLVLGVVVAAGVGEKLENFRGLWKRSPFLSIAFTVGAFSMLGFPLFGGFWSKFAIVGASVQRGGWYDFIIALVLFASVAEAFYYLRLVSYIFSSAEEKPSKIKVGLSPAIPIFVLTVSVVAIGVYPHLVSSFSNSAAAEFVHKMSHYVTNVIPTIAAH